MFALQATAPWGFFLKFARFCGETGQAHVSPTYKLSVSIIAAVNAFV